MTLRVRLLAAVALVVLLGGCADDPDTKPTFGGGSEPPGASAEKLAALKKAAGIEDCPQPDAKAAASPGSADALPDLVLDCLGGGPAVRLSDLAGRPTVVNFWASWCRECRDELPLLAKAHRELGAAVQFIGIDVDDAAPEAALRLADRAGVTYPQLVDRKTRTRASLHVMAVPQTVLVDAQGTMVHTERQPFRSYADVTAAIRHHLGVTP